MNTRLTTWADEIVTERKTIAERMIVRLVSPHRFQVVGGGIKEGLVDLQKKTCSCRVFQLDQLVCAHAISAVNIVLFYFMIWLFQPSRLKFLVFLV